jgi:hypothetical protein
MLFPSLCLIGDFLEYLAKKHGKMKRNAFGKEVR